MLQSIKFNKERMKDSAMSGFTNATDAADYLVGKGVPFRTAHEVTGKLVLYAISKNKRLEDLTLDEFNNFTYNKRIFEKDIYEKLSLQTVIRSRRSEGGTSPEAVRVSIDKLTEYLNTL